MRAKPIPMEEQYKLVLECRQSGLSDYHWCLEHDIKPGTFYNWVKRLRKAGTYTIPAPAGRDTYTAMPRQDIVKVELVGYTGALKAPVRCFGNHLSGQRKSQFRTDNECGGAAILKYRTSRMVSLIGC